MDASRSGVYVPAVVAAGASGDEGDPNEADERSSSSGRCIDGGERRAARRLRTGTSGPTDLDNRPDLDHDLDLDHDASAGELLRTGCSREPQRVQPFRR
jgi:hypothetical protein